MFTWNKWWFKTALQANAVEMIFAVFQSKYKFLALVFRS